MSYPKLLSPGRIGTLETRNRIVMAPMGSNLCEPDGTPGDRMLDYFEARARGGAGLVIVEVAAIAWPVGAANPNQLGISHDGFIPPLSRLTERIHRHGAKAALQLQHAGKVATRDIAAGRPMWVPSTPRPAPVDLFTDLTAADRNEALRDYFQPGAGASYHEMTHDDIAQMRAWFADAAVRARAAGFDAVELHAGHGYVLSAFLSPHTNFRDDEYGGALEGRSRLLVEVVRDVRTAVGDDFPLWCRLDGTEFDVPDGITVDDACRTASLALDAGLNAVHVSAYADPGSGVAFTRAPLVHEPGGFVPLAAAVKRATGAPVIAVGRLSPADAEAVLERGDADFVAMGRKLLADPELPNKLLAEREADIRPCIYSYRCVGNVFLTRGVRCTSNPSTGREHQLPHELEPAAVARRIVVIGGGPAGMETARIAAARGHHVTLLERERHLGGRARLAARIEPTIGDLLAWLERQLEQTGVDVQLGVDDWWSTVPEADAIVYATGGNVPPADAALASLLDEDVSGRALTVFGNDGPAATTAAALAERGATVTLISPTENVGVGLAPPRLWRTIDALRRLGVVIETKGSRRPGAIDFVSDDARYTEIANRETHFVGDCREVGLLDGAMLDAARVGRAL